MEKNWIAGDRDVKCFAQATDDGAWEGHILVGSARGGTRQELFLDCPGLAATETEAVEAAETWARARMPEDAT